MPSAGKPRVRGLPKLRRDGAGAYACAVRDRRQAVEIVFDHATKRYPGRATPAVDDLSLTIPAGEVCCLVGPSGGGKTTAMKLVNRLVELDVRGRPRRRPQRQRARRDGAPPRDRLRDPAGRALSAHDRRRERRDRAASARLVEARDRRSHRRAARPRRPARARLPLPLRLAALRRRAPARRAGARARGRPAADADGRALRRARPDHAHAAPERAAADPAGAAEDDHLRHARHRRGDPRRRPDRDPARGGRARAVRHARAAPRAARPTTSSRASSAPTAG